jgi:hypothetical protein
MIDIFKKIILTSAMFGIGLGASAFANGLSVADFKNPPDKTRPHTWWHWMNGHVTKESITRDLEDMKRIGLGGFTMFNTHEGIPKGPVEYGSEAWWELIVHTMDEAERLGLQMGMFNGAGWSSTGAPFVTPDKAMQEIAWTEARVEGSGPIRVQLEEPIPVLGLERDMRRDPIINQRYYMPRDTLHGWFRDIVVYAVPAIPERSNPWHLRDWRNKAAFGKMLNRFVPDDRQAPSNQVIPLDKIIDVSAYMNADGVLEWDAPAGEWTILRIGYQPTGRNNHPAAWGGRGLEIDKMSSEAIDFYWANFLDRVVSVAGDRAGSVFTSIIVDSYEVGHQNWNHSFAESFIAAKGYDFRKFLPVVTGRIIDSVEKTERLLWDYRKVIGDLIAENYYGRMTERCNEANVEFAAQAFGSFGNTNDFTVAGIIDFPLAEWWANDSERLGRITEAKLSSSAAHTYGRTLVDSEAFTGSPRRIFETHPAGVKAQGDFFLAQGVNRYSFHTWAHDPYMVGPGLGLGPYGSRLDNRNTWWPFSHAWHQYLSRSFHMLRKGDLVIDVLYFAGEEAPLRSDRILRENILPDLYKGYDYSFANEEILETLEVEDGMIVTKGGARFQVLVLPNTTWMSMATMRKVNELLMQGATVTGPRPETIAGTYSFLQKREFELLRERLWGPLDGESVKSRQVAKGMLYWGTPLDEILTKRGVVPDFTFVHLLDEPEGPTPYPDGDIEFIHRRVGTDHIYFLTNQHALKKAVEANFRVTDKIPEIWFPDSGEIFLLPDFQENDKQTRLVLNFEPEESYFIVFRDPENSSATEMVRWYNNTHEVVDLSKDWQVLFPRGQSIQMHELTCWTSLDGPELQYHSGQVIYRKSFDLPASFDTNADYWIELGDVAVIASVEVNSQECGIAWKRPFALKLNGVLRPGQNIIEITVANQWLNRLIGDQQYEDDLEWTAETGSTERGKGLVRIPDWVKNGDLSQRPVPQRKTFYAWQWPDIVADRELLPSGLLGPVRLMIYESEYGR